MAKFRFIGSEPRMLARGGRNVLVSPGDILEMDATESAVIFKTLQNPHPPPLRPWEDPPALEQVWQWINSDAPADPHRMGTAMISTTTVLTADHCNKRLNLRHTAPIEITLPTDPALGDSVQLIFAEGASADPVTINPGSNTIDGEAGPRVLTAAEDSLALYWNSEEWKTF